MTADGTGDETRAPGSLAMFDSIHQLQYRLRGAAIALLCLGLVGASESPPLPATAIGGRQIRNDSKVSPAPAAESLRDVPPTSRLGTESTGRPAAPRVRAIRMEVTAYCPCAKCCGPNAQGITASGRPVSHNGGVFVAADTNVLPFGQKVLVPGYADGRPVEVLDRGGAIKGRRLDVYFPSHRQALEWGRQLLMVRVVEE